ISAPVRRPSQWLPTFDPLVESILLRALSREPEQRYPTAHSFVDELSNACHNASEPVRSSAPSVTIHTPLRRSPRSGPRVRRWPVYLGVLVAACLFAVVLYEIAQPRTPITRSASNDAVPAQQVLAEQPIPIVSAAVPISTTTMVEATNIPS